MKKALKTSKKDAKNIARILRPHSMAIDVEFNVVSEVLLRLLQTSLSASQLESHTSSELASQVLRLSDLTTAYVSHLERLQTDSQGILRNLQSPRLNHYLTVRNSLIFQTLANISSCLCAKPYSCVPRSPKPDTKANPNQSILATALASFTSDVSVDDPVAAKFWLKHWPSDDFMVTWTQFQAALISEYPTASLKSLSALQYFIDFSNTSLVTKTRLNSLLKLCPSFPEMVPFAADLMQRSWFHGYLTKSEASSLLQQEPPNTFIVRLNKSSRGMLACSYTSSNRGVLHLMIQRDSNGYSMLNCEGSYPTLDQLIEHTPFLKTDLAQSWARSPYFLGEATKDEAEALLEGLMDGSYVVRLQWTPSGSPSPPNMLSASTTSIANTSSSSTSSSSFHSALSSQATSPTTSSSTRGSFSHGSMIAVTASGRSHSGSNPTVATNPNPTIQDASLQQKSMPNIAISSPADHNSSSAAPTSAPHGITHHSSVLVSSQPHHPHSSSANSLAPAAYRDFSFLLTVKSSVVPGGMKHVILSRDAKGAIVLGGKTYDNLLMFLEVHKSSYSIPFSPGLQRWRAHLEAELVQVRNASGHSISSAASGTASPSTRFSANLSVSVGSLSLSSSVGIPRTKSGESLEYMSSPAVSRDDLSLAHSSAGTESNSGEDELPIIDVSSLNLGIPKVRAWRPLTDLEVNPRGITFKDMWAELLRYYHVPVPEAKIPPK